MPEKFCEFPPWLLTEVQVPPRNPSRESRGCAKIPKVKYCTHLKFKLILPGFRGPPVLPIDSLGVNETKKVLKTCVRAKVHNWGIICHKESVKGSKEFKKVKDSPVLDAYLNQRMSFISALKANKVCTHNRVFSR